MHYAQTNMHEANAKGTKAMAYRNPLLAIGAATLAVSLFAGMPTASANLITNGSFEEDPGVAGFTNGNTYAGMLGKSGNASWDVFTGLPGWGSSVGSGIEVQTAKTVGLTPYDGNYYIELDSENVPNQPNSNAFQTGIQLGAGSYELSYAFTWRRDTGAIDNGIAVNLYDSGNTLVQTWDPNDTYGQTDPIPTWELLTHTFNIAAQGIYTLEFIATPGIGNEHGAFIDDVSLSAVPLPAAAWFMLTALGGLVGSRWLKKGAAAQTA